MKLISIVFFLSLIGICFNLVDMLHLIPMEDGNQSMTIPGLDGSALEESSTTCTLTDVECKIQNKDIRMPQETADDTGTGLFDSVKYFVSGVKTFMDLFWTSLDVGKTYDAVVNKFSTNMKTSLAPVSYPDKIECEKANHKWSNGYQQCYKEENVLKDVRIYIVWPIRLLQLLAVIQFFTNRSFKNMT